MAITTFDKVLGEFSASLVKESVGRTYAKRLNGMAFLVWFGWHDVLRRY